MGGQGTIAANAKAIAYFPKPAIRGEMVKTSRRMTGLRTNPPFAAERHERAV